MNPPRIFDAGHYERLNTSRGAVVSGLLSQVKKSTNLETAVDVGCGLGFFSNHLQDLGLQVTGVDGRLENAQEASKRFPSIKFQQCDAEDWSLRQLGKFDLVFCFGLLYHLQNPLLTISHLHAMSNKLLLVEGVIFPGNDPVMGLVDEGATEDQGLEHFAFYPTETCLIKMLYRVGFPYVYEFAVMPDHPEYLKSATMPKIRTMLAASFERLHSEYIQTVPEPQMDVKPWDPASAAAYLAQQKSGTSFLKKLKLSKS